MGTRTGYQGNRGILIWEGSGARWIAVKKDITYRPLLTCWNFKIICQCDACAKACTKSQNGIGRIDNTIISPRSLLPLDPKSLDIALVRLLGQIRWRKAQRPARPWLKKWAAEAAREE
jgi:hypothetical protein